MKEERYNGQVLLTGIDVGSTTTKIVAVQPDNGKIVYSEYRRHNAAQVKSVYDALKRLEKAFPHARIRLSLTGSGAKLMADRLGSSRKFSGTAGTIWPGTDRH